MANSISYLISIYYLATKIYAVFILFPKFHSIAFLPKVRE